MSRIKDVNITKVDFVPEGANKYANILLYKNKGGKINMEELIKQLVEDAATKEVGEKLAKELKDKDEKIANLEKSLNDEKVAKEKIEKELKEKNTDGNQELSEDEIIKSLDPNLQALFKKQKLQAEAAEKLAKELKEERDNEKYTNIAKSLTSTNVEDMTKILKAVAKNCEKEIYDLLEKEFKANKEQVEKSALFTEVGSGQSNETANTTWDDIVAKAKEIMIAKGHKDKSQEELVDLFLETEEGQKLYNKYLG